MKKTTRATAVAVAVVAAAATSTATSAQAGSLDTGGKLLMGVRTTDYSAATKLFAPVNATRQYFNNLPSNYRVKYPNVDVIISYNHSSAANLAQYVRSIPAGAPVELVYHHEPEGTHDDYSGDAKTAGARFVSEFNAQAAVVHANSHVAVGFIGGGYQYMGSGGGSRGIGGYFIPTTADDYFMDNYQQNNRLMPASSDPEVVHFRDELAKKGKKLNGFAEYARGTGSGVSATRARLLQADYTWFKSLGSVKIWVYWWEYSRQTNDQWKFTDSASITMWKKLAAQG